MAKIQPSEHREDTGDAPSDNRRPNRRKRGEPKLFISFLPDGKGGAKEEKGSVPLDVDVESHIEERTDCEPGLYRIEKKRGGEFSGEVLFYTKEDVSRLRSVAPSIVPETFDDDDGALSEVGDDSTPMDRLLSSLQERSGGASVMVLAKRRPDLVGMTFRNPCSAEYTVGEVPVDESDPSIEALELAIQKLYGGGRYQIVVRQDGVTVGSVVRNILDPPPRSDASAAAPSRVVGPSARSGMDEIKASVSVFKEVASVLASARPAEAEPPQEREKPLDTLRDAVTLLKEVSSVMPSPGGSGEGGGGGVRDWMDGIASLGREFGLGQALNNLIVFGLNEAARKRAEQMPASSGVNADIAGAVLLPDPIGTSAATPTPALPGLEALSPPMRVALDHALTVLVDEMRRSEECEEHETELAVASLNSFIEKFPDAFPLFSQLMAQSSTRLLLFLVGLKPEWSNLLDLEGGAGFIDAIKSDWSDAVAGDGVLDSEGGNGIHESPAN